MAPCRGNPRTHHDDHDTARPCHAHRPRHPIPVAPLPPLRGGGFTLVELMITVAIVTILAAVAIPSYTRAMDKSRITVAKRDIVDLQMRLDRYFTQRNTYPASLDAIAGGLLDP